MIIFICIKISPFELFVDVGSSSSSSHYRFDVEKNPQRAAVCG